MSEAQGSLEVFVCREASRRKVLYFCHDTQLIERRAHMDVVQLAVVVPNDGEDILRTRGILDRRVDELYSAPPAAALAAAPASPATAPPSSPPATTAAAAVGVVVVANALLARPTIPLVASGGPARKLATPVAH